MALSMYSLREMPSLAARRFIKLLARHDSFTCIRTFPVRGRPRGRFFAAFCTPEKEFSKKAHARNNVCT